MAVLQNRILNFCWASTVHARKLKNKQTNASNTHSKLHSVGRPLQGGHKLKIKEEVEGKMIGRYQMITVSFNSRCVKQQQKLYNTMLISCLQTSAEIHYFSTNKSTHSNDKVVLYKDCGRTYSTEIQL